MKKIAKVVAVNLLLIALIIAALEFVVSRFVDLPGRHIVYSYQLNHTWRPGGEKTFKFWRRRNPDFPEPYTHRYNSQGWIEAYDIQKEKPDDVYRVFYIGDSHTEGTAPMDQAVPSRVEIRLNELAREKGLDTTIEVVNTGTSSYSPTIYYILFRYFILDYDPDLIVVTVAMNDDFDDWKYAETLILDESGNPYAVPPRNLYTSGYFEARGEVVKATWSTRLMLFLSQNSAIYNYLLLHRVEQNRSEEYEALRAGTIEENNAYPKNAWLKTYEWSEQITEQVNYTMTLLKKLIALASENGVEVMVTSMPTYKQYQPSDENPGQMTENPAPHNVIREAAESVGARYLDSYQALKEHIQPSAQDYYFYKGDGHFNPRGYEIWANAHMAFLLDPKNGLLPEAFLGD